MKSTDETKGRMGGSLAQKSGNHEDCCCVSHVSDGDCTRCPIHGLNDYGPHTEQESTIDDEVSQLADEWSKPADPRRIKDQSTRDTRQDAEAEAELAFGRAHPMGPAEPCGRQACGNCYPNGLLHPRFGTYPCGHTSHICPEERTFTESVCACCGWRVADCSGLDFDAANKSQEAAESFGNQEADA